MRKGWAREDLKWISVSEQAY